MRDISFVELQSMPRCTESVLKVYDARFIFNWLQSVYNRVYFVLFTYIS